MSSAWGGGIFVGDGVVVADGRWGGGGLWVMDDGVEGGGVVGDGQWWGYYSSTQHHI